MQLQTEQNENRNRRDFLKTIGAAGAGLALSGRAFAQADAVPASPNKKLKLGFDNFSVRAMGWKAPALLDYAASLHLDAVLFSDLDAFENHTEAYLKDVRTKAADLGLQIHAGSWSICPTSKAFKNKWGTAEEHLALGIRVARAVGSPVFRCVLGTGEDRKTPGGIEARIADTVAVLKSQRSRALDAGVKIAVENHAGDMQAWELVTLIEAAGKDFVGATIDAGNAAWTFEDPLRNFEALAPYALTTGIRDSQIWETPTSAVVQWTAMGEGVVDFKTYFTRFAELCPSVPVILEIISGFPREVRCFEPDFWKVWPKARAGEFAAFLALAKRGKVIPPHKSANGEEEKEYQKGELERSIRYCKETLGLGRR